MDKQQIKEIVRQETRWLKWFYAALGIVLLISFILQITSSVKSFERNKEAKRATEKLLETNQLVRQYYLRLQDQDAPLE